MKLKEVFYSFGLKPRPRVYGYELEEQDLGNHGVIQYAHWLNPIANRHRVTGSEIDELQKFLRPGDLCVDIGPHCGDTSVPMGLAVGSEGCVVAMEPNRYLFPVLEQNARLVNERANIIPINAAATPEPGHFTFGYTDPGFCNGGDGTKLNWWHRRRLFPLEVEGVNLEDLLRTDFADQLHRLKFIKTDTEGNDLDLLQSIEGLLRERMPYLRVEVYKWCSQEYRESLYHFVRGLGYQVLSTTGVQKLFGEPVGLEQVSQMTDCDIFCVPPVQANRQVA